MNIVEEIRKFVEEECRKENNIFKTAYDYHFVDVVKYAKKLAEETGADVEIVELAAWLHDIASVQGNYDDHHIVGADVAGELLAKYNYPEERVEKIRHCIVAHRASKEIPRETIEAECVADADAMSHFDNIDALFYLALVTRKMNLDEAKDFVVGKLKRSWNKLTPRGKEMIRSKYEAAMAVLE